jgi:hypothetical protein
MEAKLYDMMIVVLALILSVFLGLLILIPRDRKSGKLACFFYLITFIFFTLYIVTEHNYEG